MSQGKPKSRSRWDTLASLDIDTLLRTSEIGDGAAEVMCRLWEAHLLCTTPASLEHFS